MKFDAKTEVSLQPPPDGDAAHHQRTREALEEHGRTRVADHRARAAKMAAQRDEERRAVAEIFGAKSDAYRKECAAWRAAQGIKRPDADVAPDERQKAAAARSRAEGRAALHRHGIDVEKLDAIRRRSAAAIEALQPKSPEDSPPLEFLPEAKVPEKIRKHNTSPWVLRTPPYDGWSWWHSWGYRGGSPVLEGYLDSATGDVGHRSSWWVQSSNDDDILTNDHSHEVGIWHWVDAPGPVEVWVKARCAITRSYMSLWEEFWEWSSAYVSHRDYVSVNVSPSNADATLEWTWYSTRSQGDDAYWHDQYPISANNVYWFHIVTTQPLPGRAWAFIRVGSRGNHYAQFNDTTGGVILQSRWFLEEIYYRML